MDSAKNAPPLISDVMQIIKRDKRKLNIRDVSNILLAITAFTSFILLFSAFFGKAEYFGWGAFYFVYPMFISFYMLVALFWVLLIYNAMYKWLIHQWSAPSLLAQGVTVIVYVILANTR